MDRLRAEADRYTQKKIPIYSIGLGDGSWDRFWYENLYPVSEFRKTLHDAKYPTPFFNIMGNHDNDGAVKEGGDVDFIAAKPYMASFGPRYYSFNLGRNHFVVLDNIVFKNQSNKKNHGNKGIYGSCNYDTYITPEQMAWLERDLAAVKDKDAPLFIAFHAPMLRYRTGVDTVYTATNKRNEAELLRLTAPFKEVHLLTGHTHMNALARSPKATNEFWDHTVAGTCGSWWWNSSWGGKNLCPDGNPVGYQVFESTPDSLTWRFETFCEEPGKQFLAMDMNSVRKFFATDSESRVLRAHYPAINDFDQVPENQVWINVWNYDPLGKLTVTAGGKELPVEMTYDENPIYTATYITRRTVWNEKYSKGYDKPRPRRIFKVQAPDADTPITISWTDRFGHTTTETLSRPAVFDRSLF